MVALGCVAPAVLQAPLALSLQHAHTSKPVACALGRRRPGCRGVRGGPGVRGRQPRHRGEVAHTQCKNTHSASCWNPVYRTLWKSVQVGLQVWAGGCVGVRVCSWGAGLCFCLCGAFWDCFALHSTGVGQFCGQLLAVAQVCC